MSRKRKDPRQVHDIQQALQAFLSEKVPGALKTELVRYLDIPSLVMVARLNQDWYKKVKQAFPLIAKQRFGETDFFAPCRLAFHEKEKCPNPWNPLHTHSFVGNSLEFCRDFCRAPVCQNIYTWDNLLDFISSRLYQDDDEKGLFEVRIKRNRNRPAEKMLFITNTKTGISMRFPMFQSPSLIPEVIKQVKEKLAAIGVKMTAQQQDKNRQRWEICLSIL